MNGRATLLLLLVSTLLPTHFSAAQQAPRRWAVVVGVNDYINFGPGVGGDLRGAERDARSFYDVLVEHWGVPRENTRLLLSRQATKAAIRDALTSWAADRAGPNDVFIFYFAGHGSQTFDQDGEEEDGLDETIAPTDAGKVSADHDIIDDELREWIEAVGASVAVVILDSCHSGSGTRATGPMRPRLLGRPRPPAKVSTRAMGPGGAPESESMADGETRILEFAAAAPDQSAMEGVFQNPGTTSTFSAGAFTFYLVQQLWEAPPNASYEALFQHVVSELRAGHFTQDPQMSGPMGDAIFATRGLPSGAPSQAADAAERPVHADEVKVLRVDGASAVLSGGGSRFITPGSLYGTDSRAVLRVTDVTESEATAAVVQGSPLVGETAVLMEVALPDPSLLVGVSYLPSDLKAKVVEGVSQTGGIKPMDDPEAPADIFLRPSEDGQAIQILGRDGGLRGTTLATGPTDETAARLARTLRKELAIKRLANLDNPAAPFEVSLDVGGGRRVFHEGDTISFRVRTERAGYLTLLDLGMDGTVTVLHPNGYEDFGRLQANQEVQVPGKWAVFTVGKETGLGLVRAIVTPEPLRIPGATRGMVREEDGASLAEEIRSLLQNQTRNIMVSQRGKPEDGGAGPPARQWATAMVVYEVAAN